MMRILTILIFTILINIASFGQVDKEYTKSLKKMFELSGTEASFQASIEQMFTMYRDIYPSIDQEIWDDLQKEFTKTSLDQLSEMLVPVYAQYLTLNDLKELIEFYKTPIGKKLAQNTPLIMKGSMQVGQEWGKKIGEEFVEKMKKKGY